MFIINSTEILDFIKLTKAKVITFTTQDDVSVQMASETAAKHIPRKYLVRAEKIVYAQVDEQCTIAISAELLENLPQNEPVQIEDNTIVCCGSIIKFTQAEATEGIYVDWEHFKCIGSLQHLLSGTYAVAKDETRPILTGVNIQGSRVICMDGYRISVRQNEKIGSSGDLVFSSDVVPILKRTKQESCDITTSEKFISFKFQNNLTIITEKIEGKYINIDQVIPREFSHSFYSEDTKPLLKILKKAKKNIVICTFTQGKLIIEGKSATFTTKDTIDIKLDGEDVTIGFSAKYFADALSTHTSANIRFISAISPLIIMSEDKLDLILPVRLGAK